MFEQRTPKGVGNMGRILPAVTIVLRTVDAGQVFFLLMVFWTAFTKVVVGGQDSTVVETYETGATEIGTSTRILKFDLIELHQTDSRIEGIEIPFISYCFSLLAGESLTPSRPWSQDQLSEIDDGAGEN